MGFVHPEKIDVFFSYARVDDNPIPGSELGWVRMFFKCLGFEIDRKLGRNGACHLWMDYELPANAKLEDALASQVRNSAVMVLVLSEGYIASEWCKGEMLGFLTSEVERRGTVATSGLFVVALDNEERPAPLKALSLVGKQFYEINTFSKKLHTLGRVLTQWQEPSFYDQIIDLSQDIAGELKRRKAAEPGARDVPRFFGNGPIPEPPPGVVKVPGPEATKVFLAEVPDGQERLRNDIKNYLTMEGYRVVPADRYPTADPAEFENAVRADLAGAKVFAQLLGKHQGASLDGTDRLRSVVQYDLAREFAREKHLMIVSGRRRTLDPEKLAAPDPDDPDDVIAPNYLALLRHPRIVPFETIEDFKRAIADRVKEALAPPQRVLDKKPGSTLVLVIADEPDEPFAEQVKKALKDRKVTLITPVIAGNVKEIRKNLEARLDQCDGVMLIYGSADLSWVDTQLLQANKVLGRRETPPRVVSVYEGPPQHDVEDLGYDPVGFEFQFLRLPQGVDERLDNFVAALQGVRV